MEEELISVIVPVYNVEEYLPKCLDSIANQTYRNLEILLVDDGSTDSSGRICDEYAAKDSRAKVIHQPNKGLWAARNTGQDVARGNFLFFSDSDDYFHFDMIRQMYRAITSKDGYDMAIVGRKKTISRFEDCCGQIECQWIERSSEDLFKRLLAHYDYPYPNIWNKLFRVQSLAGVRARPFPIAQDLDYNIQSFIHCKSFICTEGIFYHWYSHDSQISKEAQYYSIWPKIYYMNYVALPPDKEPYRGILLDQLFKKMTTSKARSLKGENKNAIFKECKEYYKNTIHDYLKEKRIPIRIKMASLAVFHFPYLGYSVLRRIDNQASSRRGRLFYNCLWKVIKFCREF